MSKSTWLSRIVGAARKPCAGRKRRGRKLWLEPLEDRCVPATFTATYFHDSFHVMGRYSLRDAVNDSNMDLGSSPDTIQLLAGIYDLSIPNVMDLNTHKVLQENAGLRGDLDITNNHHTLTIQGKTVGGIIKTTITAADLQDRLFQIVAPGTEVVFRDLILEGGLAQDDGTDNAAAGTTTALGGAILSTQTATITLDHVIVRNNKAQAGNGLPAVQNLPGGDGFDAWGGAVYATGFLTVVGSIIKNNQALGGAGGMGGADADPGGAGGAAAGGGVYFAGVGGTGLVVAGSEFNFNKAVGGAGGVGGPNTGVPNVGDPLGGTGGSGGRGQGGGVFATGAGPQIAGTFSENSAIGGAGGDGGQNVRINGQGGNGGDGGYGSGGGLFLSTAPFTAIINASITGNVARGGVGGMGATGSGWRYPGNPEVQGANGGRGGGGEGGGLTLEGGFASLGASAVVGNEAQGADGGRGADGLDQSTHYSGGQGGDAGGALGGGLFVLGPNGSLTLQGGVLSNNHALGGHGGHGGHGITGEDDIPGQGGPGGAGGQALGGGAAVVAGGLTLISVTANGNAAAAGDGGDGGYGGDGDQTHDVLGWGGAGGAGGIAQGGGLYATDTSSLGLTNVVMFSSTAAGGHGGAGGPAGFADDGDGSTGGQGGAGGAAQGGAVYTEDAGLHGLGGTQLIGSLIAFGNAFGGDGGAGGTGGGAEEDAGGSGGAGGGGGAGQGAGLFAANAALELTGDRVLGNAATGGRGGDGGQGGIAFDAFGGHGGNAGTGGGGQGGGVFADGSTVGLTSDTIAFNSGQGGDGGNGGPGAEGEDHGGAAGAGGAGGVAEGGGVSAQGTMLTVPASTVADNTLQGGDGGDGGAGGPGMPGSDAPGGDGGNGGQAGAAHGGGFLLQGIAHGHEGGGISLTGTATFTNATISTNAIRSGDGGYAGGGGLGDDAADGNSGAHGAGATKEGGGIYLNTGSLTLRNVTIAFNQAQGTTGSGGGVYNRSGLVSAYNSLFAKNVAFHGPDFNGAFVAASNNLVEDPNQAVGLMAGAGNIVQVDPKLGPLADNGGPTWTHALLAGSPAINHGNNAWIPAGVTTDQRGFARIAGGTVDIGAYELLAFEPSSIRPIFPASAAEQAIRRWLRSIDVVFAMEANTWAGLPTPRFVAELLGLRPRLVDGRDTW
jgi:hypothetical protein